MSRQYPQTAIMSALGSALLLAAGWAPAWAEAFPQTGAASRPSDDYRKIMGEKEASLGMGGADACMGCHGQMRLTRSRDNSPRDEYALWWQQGRGNHAVAFETLATNPRSRLIAQRLGGEPDAAKRSDCLSCHAVVTAGPKGQQYKLADGVGCNACHGPDQEWSGPHQYYAAWHVQTSQEWLSRGMYDTRDPVRIAQKCSECHIGSASRGVTHRMMGAGHPDLTLELVTDLDHVPKHWNDDYAARPGEGSWVHARLWAVGQAVVLYESMQRVLRWVESDQPAPDFALLDCFACHHEFLREPPIKDPNLPPLLADMPGEPPWNAAPWAACRSLLKVVSPDEFAKGEAAVEKLLRGLRLTSPDRAAVGAAATELARIADDLAAKVNELTFNQQLTRSMLAALLDDHVFHLRVGPRGAEQGFAAVDALYRRAWSASGNKPTNDAAILQTLEDLRGKMFTPKTPVTAAQSGTQAMLNKAPGAAPAGQLEPRSFDFDPAAYAAAMKQLRELLGAE